MYMFEPEYRKLFSDNTKRIDWLTLICLFLFAVVFRLIRLFDLDLNVDEVSLLLPAKESFKAIWRLCQLDNYTPFYPWLVKVWTMISFDANWFRLLGALIGSMTPPAAYVLGRELFNDRKAAWILGLITVVSVPLIFYSQFVRMFNVQPFWVCLSLIGFIRGIKTNSWRYWIVTAFANLMGFYVYYFMLFVAAGELAILLIHYRLNVSRYLRFLIVHLVFLAGISMWLFPMFSRYGQVQNGFWIPAFAWTDPLKVWLFLGTGADFRDHYLLASILNLPFLLGLILALTLGMKNDAIRISMMIFAMVILAIGFISNLGQSFFHQRYFVFLVPVYLGLVLSGWTSVPKVSVRVFGIGCVMFSMTFALLYYYIDYYEVHGYYGFVRPIPYAEKQEGHSLSRIAADVAERMKDNEVIIHYSTPILGSCSYFASLYYHQRLIPEYIYTKFELPTYMGKNYLKSGEWISSLSSLNPLPQGIWLITLDPLVAKIANEGYETHLKPLWMIEENLLEELDDTGYQVIETLQRGKVAAIHYRRNAIQDSLSSQIEEGGH